MKKISLFILLLISSFLFSACTFSTSKISKKEAKENLQAYFEASNMTGFFVKEVKDSDNDWLYTAVIQNQGTEFEAFMTKDGSKIFQSVVEIDAEKARQAQVAAAQDREKTLSEIKKNDKPKVELFVMSHCPYGTQMEKGILPVVEKLGDKIDFELKFVDYAMHGETEVKEQTAQYCIQKEMRNQFFPYLSCFLKTGESELCLSEAGINQNQLQNCVAQADQQFKITKNLEDKSSYRGNFPLFNIHKEENEKYKVAGSPTLVINGDKISTGRDSASLLKTICAGFNEQPAECQAELSTDTPAPGFGEGQAAAGAAEASCN
ncbi:MAG: thioredoxin domain-containing protein [Candidatus Woesebacteria bacterium]|jgi:hypothetical protein